MLIPRGDTEGNRRIYIETNIRSHFSWVTTHLNLLKKAWVETIVEQQQNGFT